MGRYWKWWVCGLLFFATFINYMDRQALSQLAPYIKEEMGFDLPLQGVLFLVFYWSYAIAQIIAGVLIDRVPVRLAYAFSVAAWSLAGAATGLATSLGGLIVMRALLGVFEGGNWPAAMRVVSRTFPPEQRPLANGIFQSGTSVAALVAPVLFFTLNQWFGWRVGFFAVGLIGFLWVAVWLVGYRPGRETLEPAVALPNEGDGHGSPSLAAALSPLLRSRAFWGLFLASSLLNPCMYFYVNWLPTYFKETFQQYGLKEQWLMTFIYLALDLGYLSGGALSSLLSSRVGPRRARILVIALGCVLSAGVAAVPLCGDVHAVTAILAAGAMGVGWFMSNYLSFAEEVSHERVSTVSGLLGAAGSVSGGVFMWLVGILAGGPLQFTIPFFILATLCPAGLAGIWIGTRSRQARVTA